MGLALLVLFFGALYFLAHIFAAVFNRTKIPDVLWLILVGLCLGPLFGIITPQDIGQVGVVFMTLTLIVILFHSGLGISFTTLQKAATRGALLSFVTFVVTTIVTALIILTTTDLSKSLALMIGAVVGGSSPAIVVPMLSRLNMRNESATVLLLESALADVLCIAAALAFLDVYQGSAPNVAVKIFQIIISFLLSAVIGGVAALVWSQFLERMRAFRDSVLATFAFVFGVFGLTELMGLPGFISALAFGITMGNIETLKHFVKGVTFFGRPLQPACLDITEEKFFSEIAFMLKTFFFVYVGISIQITNTHWMLIGLAITLVVFFLRIPIVRLTISKATRAEDASIMSVMVPKGLAAAALASIPLERGIAEGDLIQSVVFAVVLFSILLTSIMIFLIHDPAFSRIYSRLFSNFAHSTKADEKSDGPPVNESGATG
ncbi:NhaP-type Na+/H+ or K+/H+ antiporter [Dehalogenimonas formicexedens]|uniref:NhaP-type Na+/H+ or K+/H+ antiporter n=1 Tax=Dehalogenimonas formicexedens TaxID=1839801 RepID=A0A1P8F4N3_9CHLR|nr:cation:proton antiporter [Dehalogenimonas formicexedens]APV43431.1 NhaP-type Na+/H+ or K+/H+ antiporter [Dehalogenimonas formicexedens]